MMGEGRHQRGKRANTEPSDAPDAPVLDPDRRGQSSAAASECSAAQLFGMVWNTLSDVVGSTATATLINRSVKRSGIRRSNITQLVIARSGFEYTYTVPASWLHGGTEPLADLHQLALELSPLLFDLTGPVIIRRLKAVPELAKCGLPFEERR